MCSVNRCYNLYGTTEKTCIPQHWPSYMIYIANHVVYTYHSLNVPHPYFSRTSRNFHVTRLRFTNHIQNEPTVPGRLQVTPSQPLLAPQILLSTGPLDLHWGATTTTNKFKYKEHTQHSGTDYLHLVRSTDYLRIRELQHPTTRWLQQPTNCILYADGLGTYLLTGAEYFLRS